MAVHGGTKIHMATSLPDRMSPYTNGRHSPTSRYSPSAGYHSPPPVSSYSPPPREGYSPTSYSSTPANHEKSHALAYSASPLAGYSTPGSPPPSSYGKPIVMTHPSSSYPVTPLSAYANPPPGFLTPSTTYLIPRATYALPSGSYSAPTKAYSSKDESGPVKLHPLIIGNEIVICMPEVNKVLRNVYQVLSQANYYLSKHGISSRRYSGSQLIRIKMLGILGHDAKVCSYILQEDAERIFDSFDVGGSCRTSPNIIWCDPVLLDEKPSIQMPKKSRSPQGGLMMDIKNPGPVNVHLFQIGDDVIVCAPDVQKVIQTHFNQGATTGYYFSKLGLVPYKFVNSAHLDKVKELGIIKRSAVHCTYILQKDALRVFAAYGMTDEEIKAKINFLDVIPLPDVLSNGWTPSFKFNIKKENSPSMIGNGGSPASDRSPNRDNGETDIMDANSPDDSMVVTAGDPGDMTVNVFIVDKQEVVCMPDIHKVVQSIHGNSIQVNYYFTKLHVKKKRFCFAHLRELKNRNILQTNATYCTYVSKGDAEKLFQIYCLIGDPKLNDIKWSDPIDLDNEVNIAGVSGDSRGDNEADCLPIHTFNVDGTVVITTPDVHHIVDFLGEQSASLDYHFRKLGIQKLRFTYSQLHQLRRLQVIKRPTVCTFIAKSDMDTLLKMYATDRNRHRMAKLKWLEPIVLITSDNCASPSSPSSRKIKNSDSPMSHSSTPTASNDAYPHVYLDVYGKPYAEDREREKTNGYPPPPGFHPSQNPTSPTSHTSHAMAHIQHIHPQIDCPIVIPNGDFDPTKIGSNDQAAKHPPHIISSRRPMSDHDPLTASRKRALIDAEEEYAKRMRADPNYTHQQLLSDLNRKEIELRLLHNAYQREIDSERHQRVQLEKTVDEVKKQHQYEMNAMNERQTGFKRELQVLREELHVERESRQKLQLEIKTYIESKSSEENKPLTPTEETSPTPLTEEEEEEVSGEDEEM